MNKRWISLIIILAVVSSLGYIFFAEKYINPLFSQAGKDEVWEYAHGVDRNGNIFYIHQEKKGTYLISLDSTGRQSFKKDISEYVLENGIFGSIYADEDKNLYLTVYGMDKQSSQMTKVGIYRFRDDGSFVARVFYQEMERPYDSKFRVISSLSDDNSKLYFGFLNQASLDVYALEKGNSQLEKTHSYSIDGLQNKINAFLVLPSGDAVLSLEGSTLLRKSNRTEDMSYQFNRANVIIHSFWYAGNQLYFQDAVSGDIYITSSSTWEPYVAMRGSKIISENDQISFAQLHPLAVGNVGNVVGVYNEGNINRIFLGGFIFLPEIGKTDASASQDMTQWFIFIGIVAGVLILSLLIWDFYCNILHMRLSILIRQALLVILVIFMALYALTNYIIIPKSEEMIGNVHLTEQIKVGHMLLASAKGHIIGESSREVDQVKAADYFDQLWLYKDLVELPQELQGDQGFSSLKEAQISLIALQQGQYVVAASNANFEEGFPASRLGYGSQFIKGIKQAEEMGANAQKIMGPKGKELCVFMPTGLTLEGSPIVLSLIVDLEVLEGYIAQSTRNVALYMGIIGFILVLLVMIVENFTVYNVRKLKTNVDRIAEGHYEREVAVSSGDELEDLSNSIQALSQSILATTRSLNKLNQSYYRFVPQRFLEIIGETRIENVGKRSQAQKENVVMLFLRFRFLGSMGEKSQEIFDSINDVFENIVPVVSEGIGTVYDFLPDGFNVVFEGPPEEALRTALRVREKLESLNEKRRKKGQAEVDLRIYLAKGNIMLGFIGEEKRMEPTAISQEAQKADPILRICFESDIYIACTLEVIKDLPILGYRRRRIGEVVINGEKVELYDLFDSDPYSLLKSKEVHGERFELGVNLFMKRDYENARTMFMDIIKYNSLDGAARNYMYIAEHNLCSELKQTTYTTISELEKIR